MVQGIGIDITEIARIKQAIAKTPNFVEQVLTPAEQAVLKKYQGQRYLEYVAGRFSAKESFTKALGTGLGKVSFQDISVLNLKSGQPYVEQNVFPDKVLISISHSQNYVITQILLDRE